jgi:hypothetical protein
VPGELPAAIATKDNGGSSAFAIRGASTRRAARPDAHVRSGVS